MSPFDKRTVALFLGVVAWGSTACSGEIQSFGRPGNESGGERGGGQQGAGDPWSPGAPSQNGSAGADGGGPFVSNGGGSGLAPGGSNAIAPTKFECESGLRFQTPAMRRLTKRQYENTLRDLIRLTVGQSDAPAVVAAVQGELDSVPDDSRKQLPQDLHGSYRRLDQDVTQAHVEAWYSAAVAVGRELTTAERLERVVGACATDSDATNDAACVDGFVRRFSELAFRRPVSDEEAAELRRFYEPSTGIDPLGLADVVAGILSSPRFLYLIEHGAAEVSGSPGVYELGPFELASRLSYHFWETMPDAELLEAARSGSLLELAMYEEQLQRLFDDPRTRATVRGFTRDWLKLDDLEDLTKNVGATIFRAFAGNDLPDDALRSQMIEEVLDLVDYYTWVEPSGLDAILTTNRSFARSPELAAMYGVEPWDGSSPPPSFPSGERPGVLTRGAFLATGTAMTRPIMRGVFFRTNVLCDRIPPPPDNAAANPPVLSETLSTREVVEALTQEEGTVCAGCHGLYINPIGFAFEGYDALGRVRREQTLFSDDGEPLGAVAVDTRTTPQIVIGDDSPSNGPEDVMNLALESGKAQACVSRHYFRFTFGRWEDLAQDGCTLESVRTSLSESGNFARMLMNVATTDAFRRRTFD